MYLLIQIPKMEECKRSRSWSWKQQQQQKNVITITFNGYYLQTRTQSQKFQKADGWTNGQTILPDGRMDGRTNQPTNQWTCFHWLYRAEQSRRKSHTKDIDLILIDTPQTHKLHTTYDDAGRQTRDGRTDGRPTLDTLKTQNATTKESQLWKWKKRNSFQKIFAK